MVATSYEAYPQEMRGLPQWVCHCEGKKVPIDPKTGRGAKANDPTTWGTFEQATEWVAQHGGGIGFEFTEADPFCGIDLDHVRDKDSGELVPWARDVVDALDTYTEVSPSGTGLHLIAQAKNPGDKNKCNNQDGTSFEMYDHARYFRMTGDVFEGHAAIGDRQKAVSEAYGHWIEKPHKDRQKAPQDALDWDSEIVATSSDRQDTQDTNTPLSTDVVLERMKHSSRWPKIALLWEGDTSGYDGDDSRADQALCNHLAYFCDRDTATIDDVFRRSGLMRDKWDERRGDTTYGGITIQKAQATCKECYSERKMRTDAPAQEGTSDAFVSLYDITGENLPEQDSEIVEGILRERQVLLLAAPSKAGKTWLAVALMWALATGGEWLGAHCEKSVVVYCNLEVSPASFATRCEAVREEMGIPHDSARMVSVLNGRGVTYTAASLVDAVLAHLRGTSACVIVDCLYAIEAGSENDAEAIRAMFAELDKLTKAGCSVVGIHHFPKGSSGMKASIDRMAGSSVFARSPDALLSLDPLDVDEESDEGRNLVEAGCKAYRLSFDLRDFKPRRPVDLIFTGTRFLPDASGRLSMSHIAGSPQAGGTRGGKRNAERNALEWDRKAELVQAAIADCESKGIPASKDNVLGFYNTKAGAYGLNKIRKVTFRDWVKPQGQLPFHTEEGILCPD